MCDVCETFRPRWVARRWQRRGSGIACCVNLRFAVLSLISTLILGAYYIFHANQYRVQKRVCSQRLTHTHSHTAKQPSHFRLALVWDVQCGKNFNPALSLVLTMNIRPFLRVCEFAELGQPKSAFTRCRPLVEAVSLAAPVSRSSGTGPGWVLSPVATPAFFVLL